MRKTIIVTGANTGIGKATAMGCAAKGCHVIMACRNRTKGENARREIAGKTGNKTIDLLILDLSSPQSIKECAKKILHTYPRIDVLINNAGVSIQKPKKAIGWGHLIEGQYSDGIEWTFAVNHLGPFLFTHLLLDCLKKSSPSRIITVASSVASQGRLDLEDLNMESKWDGFKAYANSKLCNIYFTYELAYLLEGTGVTANCLGPGLVNSDFFRNYKKLPFIFRIIKKLIGKTPEQGARTSIYLALSEAVNILIIVKRKKHLLSRIIQRSGNNCGI
jgi:NAD(P)-dependent dehydrogenase (short-subunit alcohol dehydrogenase family)